MSSPALPLSSQFFTIAAAAQSSPSTSARFPQQTSSSLRISASFATTAERPRIVSNNSLYEILGIQMGATCQEIKTAYRRLARVLHPDVLASNGGREDSSTAANEFMEVHKAYATLSDPEKRADYDRLLFRQIRPYAGSVLSSATTYSSGYTRRNWETDQCW